MVAAVSRWRQQLREALRVTTFPVISWLGAGTCLLALYFIDLPNRQQQRLERQELAARAAAGEGDQRGVQVLENGAKLLQDGSLVRP